MQTSQVALVVKNPPANEGDITEASSIPGLVRSSGRGHGNPLQHSCLKNSMDKPIIQSEVSQKDKEHYSILTHIYGI